MVYMQTFAKVQLDNKENKKGPRRRNREEDPNPHRVPWCPVALPLASHTIVNHDVQRPRLSALIVVLEERPTQGSSRK